MSTLRLLLFPLICVSILMGLFCKSGPQPDQKKKKSAVEPKVIAVSPELRKCGLISSSIYQVFVTVFAESEEEARRNGLPVAHQKALNLMRKDPGLSGGRVNEQILRELRRLIRRNGRVFRIFREPNGTWGIVFRVEKDNLRGYIRRLY